MCSNACMQVFVQQWAMRPPHECAHMIQPPSLAMKVSRGDGEGGLLGSSSSVMMSQNLVFCLPKRLGSDAAAILGQMKSWLVR